MCPKESISHVTPKPLRCSRAVQGTALFRLGGQAAAQGRGSCSDQGRRQAEEEERYYIDLRWKEAKTRRPMRYSERFAPGISAAAAKERARAVLNGTSEGTFEKNPEEPKTIADALAEYKLGRRRTDRSRSVARRACARF